MTASPAIASSKGTIGFLAAVSIGVGGMVGGGIFAVLGLAVGVGGGGTFIAFLVAGMVALVTTYSYARLSVEMPSDGGTDANQSADHHGSTDLQESNNRNHDAGPGYLYFSQQRLATKIFGGGGRI